MTQVAMIFEEEKQRAVEEERKKASDSERRVVEKMIDKGYPTEEIVFLMPNYSKADVEALRKGNAERAD